MGSIVPLESLNVGFGGHGCIDLAVGPFDTVPKPNGLALMDEARIAVGGNAVAAAVTGHRLGVNAKYFGVVGDDDVGEVQLFLLQRLGLNTDGARKSGKGSASAVLAGAEARRFLHASGANATHGVGAYDVQAMEGIHGLLFSGLGLLDGIQGLPCAQLFTKVRRGVQPEPKIGVDTVHPGEGTEFGSMFSALEAALPLIDLFCTSVVEAPYFCSEKNPEKIARFFRERVRQAVIVKMGAEGMLLYTDKAIHIPPYQVVEKDGTGAGDAACGATFISWLQGYPLEHACRFGSAVGAMIAQRGQGVTAAPTINQVQSFMSETPIKGN